MDSLISIGGDSGNEYYLKFGVNKYPVVWDILAFRPDPKLYLNSRKNYKSKVILKDIKKLPSDQAILIPQKLLVDVDGEIISFINIRCPR
ncbi:hypothetical protein OAG24_00140 [bacterium]|nr:hypothetical protein [bacterium]